MRYLCIHGHFYQPPRENPWLEAIELQDSAYPYHDWNERITAECYATNSAARILDAENHIVKIVNNYRKISFNFGPTLLSWAKENAPELYQNILTADKESLSLYNGHGSAIAQAYNHIIMPLANRRDKETQIVWGLCDFQKRFGRKPEGMWLPETAVDIETLELLAQNGINYTILAPYQAKAFREIGRTDWTDVTGGRIDPTRAYVCPLPSGASINLFFYDGPSSRAVAFEGLLANGERFAERLLHGYPETDNPCLVHIATDGETYGHHHRYGEMALAYALEHIDSKHLARVINYGEFLSLFPPKHEVQIYENTAWSCSHGVGRWSSNCGCNTGGHGGWNQNWRAPLREALDWLRDAVAPKYEEKLAQLLDDPWMARNDYIDVILDRSSEVREAFLARHSIRPMNEAESVRCWKLLELQRNAMLMYTSCGWFFDELSGIETVQVIQYAGRVVQLAEQLFHESYESEFLALLEKAKSNLPEYGDGASIYRRYVKPNVVDLRKVAAHYAISSVFQRYADRVRIYCYSVDRQDYRIVETGRLKLAMGRARFTSEVTQASDLISFGVLHFGDHNLNGGVREFRSEQEYDTLMRKMSEAFFRADLPEVIRLLDRGFGVDTYALKSLFRDEQRAIVGQILTSTLDETEAMFRQQYEDHAPLMRFLTDLRTPLPKAFRTTAEFALNSHLRRAFSAEPLDLKRIENLIEEARLTNVDLDATTLEFTVRKNIERLATKWAASPRDRLLLRELNSAMGVVRLLPFPVTLWSVQNICYAMQQTEYPLCLVQAPTDENAREWLKLFASLAEKLSLKIPPQ